MEQLITHACGHDQTHFLVGYASQQERKARWLRTTSCRNCFVAAKRLEENAANADHLAAVAHLDLPALTGSDRQIAWATTIRARRLAGLLADPGAEPEAGHHACRRVTEAKWWIDHREAPTHDLLTAANGLAPDTEEAA